MTHVHCPSKWHLMIQIIGNTSGIKIRQKISHTILIKCKHTILENYTQNLHTFIYFNLWGFFSLYQKFGQYEKKQFSLI